MKIYVASSWRCPTQPAVVEALRAAGHDVYDFRNPPNKSGFGWHQVDPAWRGGPVTPETYPPMIRHPIAMAGFEADMRALEECDACVLVLPCGRSAHLEAGIAIGQGKPVCILLNESFEPELMYLATAKITGRLSDVVTWAEGIEIDMNDGGEPLHSER